MTFLDSEQLAARGRERLTTTLWARVYWSLVGMSTFTGACGLFFESSSIEVWVILCAMVVSAVAAIWVADYLLAPVYSLKRRLELKNYGDRPADSPVSDDALDAGQGGFELGARFFTMATSRNVDLIGGLPVELASIERLARAGRVSEVAMESVKRDLFRHLSHQLKSPLALVRAHAQTAGRALECDDQRTVTSALSSIEAISLNTSGLVETMLSLAWVEGLEEQGLANEKSNLSAAIMELAGFRDRALEEKKMQLTTQVQAGLWVRGQHQLLQEMVASVLDNAIRYGPASSAISIEAQRLPTGRAVVVTVTDCGPGIPSQERDRVFEPFYGCIGLDSRGTMTYGTRRHRALGAGVEKSSHGLGLALVKAVAKLHGASVSLDSGPGGVGLRVRIVLGSTDAPEEESAKSEVL